MSARNPKLILVLLAALSAWAVLPAPPPASSAGRVQNRIDRLGHSEQKRQEQGRVTLNVHYEVPVVDALGYLAASYEDPDRLVEVSSRLRPIVDRVRQISGMDFEGRRYQASLKRELTSLRAEMMDTILVVYGTDAIGGLERYLTRKYLHLRDGLALPPEDL